jgi:putative tricarboxylic transport membrane protein
MRRDEFLRSLAALVAGGTRLPAARAGATLRMLIPSNPSGGWDATGRALGSAMLQAKAVDAVRYDNRGGAAGVIGLAQFAASARADPDALMMMGAVMLGGIIAGKPPVSVQSCTALARLTSEYNVFVLPAGSPLRNMKDVVAQFKKDPASIKWGGGSRGSTEHIAACMLARQAGVDPKKINYVAFRGGGEASAAVLAGSISVGGSSYSEFAEYIRSGRMKPIGVTSPQRLQGIDVPTLKEQCYDVVLGNWRGVYGGPGITAEQRAALTDIVVRATRTRSWQDALEKNRWKPALLTGRAFEEFVAREFSSLTATMHSAGMV